MFKSKGFTLMEMLISIGIMAVIMGAAVATIGPGPKQASRDAKRKADLAQIVSAIEIYRSDNPGYPSNLTIPNYLPVVPTDPIAGRNYAYVPGTCSGGFCKTYVICASLEKNYATLPVIPACTLSCGQNCNYSVSGP